MEANAGGLTVAVTGPTGTFGFGLIPLLERDSRVGRVIGIARRPFDPSEHGWSKMSYRQGDVRDRGALEAAFGGADVVVHLAFWVAGSSSASETRRVNVEGTVNAFEAAAAAGTQRFVYASSVAAYGFHADNPLGLTEDWPVRPAERLFYAQEKAELEVALQDRAEAHPNVGLYLLRPPIVLGPHAIGAKQLVPDYMMALVRRATAAVSKMPLRMPVLVPEIPLQLIHEDDVGQALLLCTVGAGPPGAYNIAADDVVTTADVTRELGLRPVPVPASWARRLAGVVSAVERLPFVPQSAAWAEAASRPVIMDTTKAKRVLGWRPAHSALEALRASSF